MVIERPEDRVSPIKIEDEMRQSYLDYAMSVIVSRALPDVRDGLKPVQRRILYAMNEIGLRSTAAYKKSAATVGDVMAKYHPHGDAPIYDAMVRMAQDFSLRYPLIDGQGNFGSIDADPPAAMRYTEARLATIADEMLQDIDKNTVNFKPNYDGSHNEPDALPARLPNLLINGSTGIAVGMATNIPPHNLTEICTAITRLIEKPDTTTEELIEIVRGPDFPTAAIVIGRDGIKNAYATGQGRVVMRARAHIEEMSKVGRYQIVVTELPYQTNKAALIEKMADMVKDKKIEGISDLRDESDRHGMRVVIELKAGGQPKQILNVLYKHTAMQSAFNVHMLCLVNGQPKTVNLRTALIEYINFRREVVRRRSQFDLDKAREREHIVSGLLRAIDKIDAIIRLIRGSESAAKAREQLQERPFSFSERQAQAILEMRLAALAALQRQQLLNEHGELLKTIAYLEELLANQVKLDAVIKEETLDLRKKHGDERRTQIVDQELQNFSDEDLIPHEAIVVTLSRRGYIKRIALDTYRPQRRGGKGLTGMPTREEDAVHRLLVADTHDNLLFFTDRGKVFQLRAHEIPDASRQAKGLPLINLIDINQGEMVTALIATATFAGDCLLMATKHGEVKRTPLHEFESVRRNGLIAMDLAPVDALVSVKMAKSEDDLVLCTADGQAIRFPVSQLRMASRQSGGVRGIKLDKSDAVIGMEIANDEHQLLTISERGFGKRSPFSGYPTQNRAGGGVANMKLTDKTGRVSAVRSVNGTRELIIITLDGIVLRTTVDTISSIGRNTMGVKIMNMRATDTVAAIAGIEGGDDEPAPSRRRRAGAGEEPASDGHNGTNGVAQLAGFSDEIIKSPRRGKGMGTDRS
ncbi:MAG: DNA gyrase subunit A [Dehalococcoidia bacterium]